MKLQNYARIYKQPILFKFTILLICLPSKRLVRVVVEVIVEAESEKSSRTLPVGNWWLKASVGSLVDGLNNAGPLILVPSGPAECLCTRLK